jgi:CRISPR-associated protein Csm5
MPQQTSINQTHRIKLTTVTPVSIGDGGSISPLADFTYDESSRQLYFLNQSAFEQLLQSDTNHLEAYIQEVDDSTSVKKDTMLVDFIERATGQSKPEVLSNYFHPTVVTAHGLNNALETATIVKNIDQPYIPGSTLKGAIRTAILYDWLLSKQGEREVERYLETLQKWDASKARRREMERDAKRNILNEDDLFGSLRSTHGHESRRIKLSDSTPLNDALIALNTIRMPLRKGNRTDAVLEVPREAIAADASTRFVLGIEPPFHKTALKWLAESDTATILRRVSNYTKDCVAYELYELDKAAQAQNANINLQQLINFYTDLQTRMDNGEHFLRIGFGKTRYDNSLSLSLLNGFEDEEDAYEAFDLFRLLFWRLKEDQLDDLYPVTRTVTAGYQPLGWVKLESI